MLKQLRNHPLFLFENFRRLFFGRLISAVGDKFFTISLAWWIISTSGEGNKLHLGLLMAVNIAPVVLFGPVMGTLADRFSKKMCMIAADILRGAIMFLMFILFSADLLSLPILYLLVFILSTFVPLFESSANASIARLTDETHLARAVALDSSVIHISNIAGALIGSLFLAFMGVGGAFLVNAITFFISLFFIMRIRLDIPSEENGEEFMNQFKSIFPELKKMKPILMLMLLFAALNFFAAPLMLLIPMIVKFVIKQSVSWVAILEFFLALGSGVTALILSFKGNMKNAYPRMFGALFSMGCLILLLAATTERHTMALLLLFCGISLATVDAIAIMIFHHTVPDNMKGRFFSLLTTLCFSVVPLAYIVNGVLSDIFSVPVIVAINGAGNLILSFGILIIPRIVTEEKSGAEGLQSERVEEF